MKVKLFALGMLVLASTSFAANVDGTWSGTVNGPSGPVEVRYEFMADGAELTGSTVTPDGAEFMIRDGKIDGDIITFAVDIDVGGIAMTFNYTGMFSGDQLELHTEFMGQPFDFVLEKTG